MDEIKINLDRIEYIDHVSCSQSEQLKEMTEKRNFVENRVHERMKGEYVASRTSGDNTCSSSFTEEYIDKEIIQMFYDKGWFDNFPKEDRVFEPYLKILKDYFLKKYGEDKIIDANFNYRSDLE